MLNIGSVLRHLRDASGYTQESVATYISKHVKPITRLAVRKWESDEAHPNAVQFLYLCRLYRVYDLATFFPDEYSDALTPQHFQKLREFAAFLKYQRRPQQEEPIQPDTLELFDIPAAAGTGQMLDGSYSTPIPRDDTVPPGASFAVRVQGDSMEPRFYDGQTVWVHQQKTLESGEVGVFSHNGDSKIKQLLQKDGTTYLVSFNAAYSPLPIHPDDELIVFGKVIGLR